MSLISSLTSTLQY